MGKMGRLEEPGKQEPTNNLAAPEGKVMTSVVLIAHLGPLPDYTSGLRTHVTEPSPHSTSPLAPARPVRG